MPNAPLPWSERGSLAVDAGDLATAKQCFFQAVRSDSRNAKHRFCLGEYEGAAERLTQALRLDPRMADAARRLGLLIDRFSLDARLDRVGLKYALHHDQADREAIARGAIRYLSAQSPLAVATSATRWARIKDSQVLLSRPLMCSGRNRASRDAPARRHSKSASRLRGDRHIDYRHGPY